MMKLNGYRLRGGLHPETATLANALTYAGTLAPHTQRPFSEALLLGIGGGLGAGYILWEFKAHEAAILVMGFRNRWNYPLDYYTNLCGRLKIPYEIRETSGKKAATANLHAAIENDQAAICWVDQAHMSYLMLGEQYHGCFGYQVNAYEIDDEDNLVMIDDRNAQPLSVGINEFAVARARIPSFKNRSMTVATPQDIDLVAAILAGIKDHIEHLSRASESFSLPVYKKWAKLMTDSKNKKGWPNVFADRVGLYSTLQSIYEGVKPVGPAGGALRGIYADFLEEASPLVNNPALKQAAQNYRHLEGLWNQLGDTVLSDEVPEFKDAKQLVNHKQKLVSTRGDLAREEIQQTGESLQELQRAFNRDFPLNDLQTSALFNEMQAQLYTIYDAEVEALETLKQAVA